ncbi:MAG TPA: uracil-DNA glycosylase family protein [Longimicrobiales bacterium]|nr:uracil-DNA glycosylase family protein [Longimicrobiales bacterium]
MTRVQPEQRAEEAARFRAIFRTAHRGHAACAGDEWLMRPCAAPSGEPLDRPVVWSRRNGPWRRVEILWIGAAPGNAGGKGSGPRGAHGTRIPFGGDVAGANLEVLFSSIGINRNETFIAAALNQLPARGGGEPTTTEINAPIGGYATSVHLLRDTILAAGPRLVVLLGAVALRTAVAAVGLATRPAFVADRSSGDTADPWPVRLPTTARIEAAGIRRGNATSWPDALAPSEPFFVEWRTAWGDSPLPAILWLLHPSAQNMSPFAGPATAFHQRMVETRAALIAAARTVLGREPCDPRPYPPTDGIYALPEWREHVAPALEKMDALWRARGV